MKKKLLPIIICILITMIGILPSAGAGDKIPAGPDLIGIIGAMDEEVTTLKAALENTQISVIAGMEFCKGKLDGIDVVIVQCGMG